MSETNLLSEIKFTPVGDGVLIFVYPVVASDQEAMPEPADYCSSYRGTIFLKIKMRRFKSQD